jgi:eukaryotic-like serine/threonine-protein kinase
LGVGWKANVQIICPSGNLVRNGSTGARIPPAGAIVLKDSENQSRISAGIPTLAAEIFSPRELFHRENPLCKDAPSILERVTMNEGDLFADALALPRGERASFLDRVCAGDPQKRARIEDLLTGHEEAEQFMASPVAEAFTKPDEKPGDRIGRYKLLQQIGEGGCGIVYMAEQDEPVRRRVALKVIKLGMDTKEVIARFEAERQALALMDHPNIARVFDAGATESGRPYFVMELVRGLPITKFCDEHSVSTAERLKLLTEVCHAIQHAHQKGIIHRDIKPSNILVTLHDDIAVPKVIDFGIAKATHGRLTDHTLFTAFEQFIGTPAYMSPEQAELNGLDVDTRSDIYSLGVLLYELLTGQPPFDPKTLVQAGLDEIRRVIREVDPPRMSTRLSTLDDVDRITIARQRATAPAQLSTLLRGDLDWIVMMTLEKNRSRRYETANELALDILRYLHDEPVIARPPSAAYRMSKFVRRNRLVFGATMAVVIALCGGLAVATWRYQREKIARAGEATARELAERRRSDVENINRFLVSDMLGSANPEVAQGREITVKDVLDNAAARIPQAFTGNPLLEASIRHAIGVSYQGVGQFDAAERQILAALETRRRLLGPEHADTLDTQSRLGALRRKQQKLPEAEKILRETRALQIRLLGPGHEQTLATTEELCMVLSWAKRPGEAEPLAREAWLAGKKHLGAEHRATLATLHGFLGSASRETKRREGDALYAELLSAQRRVLGPDHPETLGTMNDYGRHLHASGRRSEAGVELLREAVERAVRVTGPDHVHTILIQSNHAWLLCWSGRREEGLPLARKVVETSRRVFGPDKLLTQDCLNGLAEELNLAGRWSETVTLLREWIPLMRSGGVPFPKYFGWSLTFLGHALNESGEFAEAEMALREAGTVWEKIFPQNDYRHAIPRAHLGVAVLGQKRFAEAEPTLITALESLARVKTTAPNAEPARLAAIRALVKHYSDTGQPSRAANWQKSHDEELILREDQRKWEALLPADVTSVLELRTRAQALTKEKRLAEAAPVREQLVRLLQAKLGESTAATLFAATQLAECYHELGRFAEALALAEQTLSLRRAPWPRLHGHFAVRRSYGADLSANATVAGCVDAAEGGRRTAKGAVGRALERHTCEHGDLGESLPRSERRPTRR